MAFPGNALAKREDYCGRGSFDTLSTIAMRLPSQR
jgi:hypothetical protein